MSVGPPPSGIVRVAGIAGSLRKGSFNLSLLRAAAGSAPADVVVDILDIFEIPLLNVDLEHHPPEPISRFHQAVRDADGVLIATPEYNAGLAGVTKNLIDWASRPSGDAVLAGKPVALMGATRGNWGTVRAQAQLRQSLSSVGAFDMKKPEIMVPHAATVFDETGALVDDGVRRRLGTFMEAFRAWILFVASRDGGA